MCSSLRVLVADDHDGMLKIVSEFLNEQFSVVKAVNSGDDLIQAAVELTPEVIVADVDMPGSGGVEVMRTLRSLGINIPFVLMGAETKCIARFLKAGAAAYVHKYDVHCDLIEAVLLAASGGTFLSRSVAGKKS